MLLRRDMRCVWLVLWGLAGQASAGLLRDAPPAHWIRAAGEIELAARREFIARSQFRTEIEGAGQPARLELRTLGHVRVLLEEQVVFEQLLPQGQKEQRLSVQLTPPAGIQILRIDVANPHGPAALLARCESLGVASSGQWQARAQVEGRGWAPALHLLEHRLPGLAEQFPHSFRALAKSAVYFTGLWALAWIALRRNPSWLHPERFRFLLMLFWAGLAIWNLPRLPADLGFDAPFHLEYVGFVQRSGHLPLASDGWQMFQTPLYYLLAAGLYRLLEFGMETAAALRGLRVLSLLCGLIQIELAFRALRCMYRDRPEWICAGTAFAGFLPINLYMSQWVGNEPLVGVLGAWVLLLCLGHEGGPMTARRCWLLGALLGLAILSKVSALLLLPPVLGFLLWRSRAAPVAAALRFLAATALVCGWFFVRNWIELGRPLVLSSQDVEWWQAPGFRSWQQLYDFGVSLTRPVMAGLHSFADAVYSTLWLDGQLSSAVVYTARPPWNYDFLLACAPLAIVPSALLVAGFIVAWRRHDARLVLLAATLGIYVLALLQQYVALPIFSTGKASYTLALLPAYAILTLSGLDALAGRRPFLVRWLASYLCAFAGMAYLSYLAS